jgi:hypothetical protein
MAPSSHNIIRGCIYVLCLGARAKRRQNEHIPFMPMPFDLGFSSDNLGTSRRSTYIQAQILSASSSRSNLRPSALCTYSKGIVARCNASLRVNGSIASASCVARQCLWVWFIIPKRLQICHALCRVIAHTRGLGSLEFCLRKSNHSIV